MDIDLFVRAALPRALRIAEADLDVGHQREAFVIGHLLAAIPGQRLVQLPRQFVHLPDQRINDPPGRPALSQQRADGPRQRAQQQFTGFRSHVLHDYKHADCVWCHNAHCERAVIPVTGSN